MRDTANTPPPRTTRRCRCCATRPAVQEEDFFKHDRSGLWVRARAAACAREAGVPAGAVTGATPAAAAAAAAAAAGVVWVGVMSSLCSEEDGEREGPGRMNLACVVLGDRSVQSLAAWGCGPPLLFAGAPTGACSTTTASADDGVWSWWSRTDAAADADAGAEVEAEAGVCLCGTRRFDLRSAPRPPPPPRPAAARPDTNTGGAAWRRRNSSERRRDSSLRTGWRLPPGRGRCACWDATQEFTFTRLAWEPQDADDASLPLLVPPSEWLHRGTALEKCGEAGEGLRWATRAMCCPGCQ